MIKKKAFTAIEIMVVLAIIALLIAISLPALQKARELSAQQNKIALTVESNMNNRFPRLPLNATMIKDHGNGWYEFTLDNKQYLYRLRDDNICILIGENDE